VSCEAAGANCGSISDGCGRQVSCGACSGEETCGGGGVTNRCGLNYQWANWRVPDSTGALRTFIVSDYAGAAPSRSPVAPTPGQLGYGQDGNYLIQPASYTVGPGEDTVTDDVTGLMWMRTAFATEVAWAAAVADCDALAMAGFDDWRLPSRVELYSIWDSQRATGAYIDTLYFDAAGASREYWTTTRSAGNAWALSFSPSLLGNVQALTTVNAVRCVRSTR